MENQKKVIEEWRNNMVDATKEAYTRMKEILPTLLVLTEEGKHLVVGMPFSNQREKEHCSQAAKSIAREKKAIAVMFVHEAYAIRVDEKDRHKIVRPDGSKIKDIKDVEGRMEVIHIYFETKAGEHLSINIEINNKTMGKETCEVLTKSEGLFSNFFDTPSWMN